MGELENKAIEKKRSENAESNKKKVKIFKL